MGAPANRRCDGGDVAERDEGPRITAGEVEDATLIAPLERDIALDLHSEKWGAKLSESWRVGKRPARYFYRDMTIQRRGRNGALRDHIVRFPSAPIYGINRKQDYEVDFRTRRPNLHTLRLLTRPGGARKPVDRLFILHNGLNESQNLRFFFQVADWILEEDEAGGNGGRSACLIAPFPGHLMHFPFPGPFAQTPLSRYLNDAGELFRQFLRYMVEMHWLISLVGGTAPEEWMVGGDPLGSASTPEELLREWHSLRKASFDALQGEDRTATHPPNENALVGQPIDLDDVRSVMSVLRRLLGRNSPDAPASLPVHVVGYSLGGFLAQSVFFAWPNIVASCATICSGGAIRALSPTAFAHREEWQAVLHSLRPEIEGSMLSGKLSRAGGDGPGLIAGMPTEQFGYFHRIFDQVFLQEDHASYRERLSEYVSRMLFINGGDDPIVQPRNVLDASPAEGITMLSVARLTHFLGEDPQTAREVEQREFWMPEVGGLIARAARRAEDLKADEFERATDLRARAARGVDARRRRPRAPRVRDLPSPEFENALDWVVDLVKPDRGWLFVCRNGVPAAFLPRAMHPTMGAALHHHDVVVQDYATGLTRRARALNAIRQRVTLSLSHNLRPAFVGTHELFDPHSDAPGKLSTREERAEAWNAFLDGWGERVQWFKPGMPQSNPSPRRHEDQKRIARRFARRVAGWQEVELQHLQVARLPDVWIAVDVPAISLRKGDSPERAVFNFVDWVSEIVAEHQSRKARDRTQRKSDELKKELDDGNVRIVRVSGTELNPRYRGRFEQSLSPALLLLAHCAAGLVRSSPNR